MKLYVYNWGHTDIFCLSELKYDIEYETCNTLLIYKR
jgi:hypothetical protein